MKYSEFKSAIKDMLLEDGIITGTETYVDRYTRVSLLEVLLHFPTLRPDSVLNITSADVIIEGNACEVGIPSAIKISEIRVVPSGWVATGDELEATIDGGGVIAPSHLVEGDTIVLTDSGETGLATDRLYLVTNAINLELVPVAVTLSGNVIGLGGIVLTSGEAYVQPSESELTLEITPLAGTIKFYKAITTDEYETKDRLGPLDYLPWSDRYRMINGQIAPCDLLYAVSPDRDRIIVHPIINFEKVLQITYSNPASKFEDDDVLHIPDALEDIFITVCTDYVRSRIAKDIDRNANMAAINLSEFRRGLRTIFSSIPR